ncbi:MAG: SDR family oxidoreductase [Ilumatobacteraceae bacterium]
MAGQPLDPVAIVTDASRGVGRTIARRLARSGWAVVVVYLDDQLLAEATVEEILAGHGTALAVRADVTDDLDVERLFTESRAVFDDVDVVVHTTGGSTAVVDRHAARQLRRGGAILGASRAGIPRAVVDVLRARDITIVGRPADAGPAGGHHDVVDVVDVVDVDDVVERLERWRRRS